MRRFLIAFFVLMLATLLVGCGGSGSSSTQHEILVGSSANGKILRYNAISGDYLGVFAQGEPLISPNGIGQLPNGNVVVGDYVTHKVLLYSDKGAFIRELGTLAGTPYGLVVLSNGDFLVSEHDSENPGTGTNTGRVVKYTQAGGFQTLVQDTHLNGPDGLAVGPDGALYVSSQNSSQVLKYNLSTGAFLGVFASGAPLGAPHAGPSGLVFGPDGNLYVSQHDTDASGDHAGMVLRYDGTTGAFVDQFVPVGTAGLSGPIGVGFLPFGDFLVTSAATNQVLLFSANGQPAGHLEETSDLVGPIYFALVTRSR
jgi:WD40 repeat protein